MGSIFNEAGVPHLSTPNAGASTSNYENVSDMQPDEIFGSVANAETTRTWAELDQMMRDDVAEQRRKNDQLRQYYQESGKRLDIIVEEIDELGLYLGLDDESDYDSDSIDQLAEIGRQEPLPSADGASTELVSLADCYNLPSFKSDQREIDRNSDPAAEQMPCAWSGPSPESTSPLDTFFKHYFLSDRTKRNNWIPSRRKTKEPIILYGATDINEIHKTAKRIKGLHACSAGAPPNRIVVLGWDRLAVWQRASQVSASSYSEDVCRYIFDTARRFAKAMNGERVGLRLNKAESWAENAVQGILDHFQGSYLVRWRDIGGGWDVRAVLGLEIGMGPRKNILKATLRFPGAEEKMLLAHKFKTLDAYLDASLKEKDEDGDDNKGEKTGDGKDEKASNGNFEKPVGIDTTKPGGDNREKAAKSDYGQQHKPIDTPEHGAMENPISSAAGESSKKPPRGTMGNPHEFSFIAELCYRVIGRSTEGCRGRIHWTADQTFTSFTGNGFLPYLCGRVEMEGWEI
ncbi:hypothetical protein PMIN06_000082 [Paraphaeosphaeria minitans]